MCTLLIFRVKWGYFRVLFISVFLNLCADMALWGEHSYCVECCEPTALVVSGEEIFLRNSSIMIKKYS